MEGWLREPEGCGGRDELLSLHAAPLSDQVSGCLHRNPEKRA